MRVPPTRVELAWAYMSNSTGVFMAIHPRRRIGSGALETDSGRRVILSEYLSQLSKKRGKPGIFREGEGAGRGEVQLARVEEVEHGVLKHLGVDGEVLEGAIAQAADDGVGDGADAGLQRQQVLGEAAALHFMGEEVHDVAGDRFGGFVHLGEGPPLVAALGLDDGDDLVRVAGDIGGADTLVGAGDEEGLPVRRLLLHDDVVHPLEGGLSGVDFEDDLVGGPHQFGNDAAGGGQGQAAVLVDGGDLDDGDIHPAVLGVEAVADVLSEDAQVFVAHADARRS